jgi:hypothetical protein
MIRIGIVGDQNERQQYIASIQSGNSFELAEVEISDVLSEVSEITHPDALLIIGYLPTYLNLILNAFRQGKHVLLASPLLFPAEELELISKSRKEANVQCLPVISILYQPAIVSLLKQRDGIRIVELSHLDHLVSDVKTSHVLTDIALLSALISSEIKRISSVSNQLQDGSHHTLFGRLEFINGSIGILQFGDNGFYTTHKLTTYSPENIIQYDFNTGIQLCIDHKNQQTAKNIHTAPHDLYTDILSNFEQCILGKSTVLVNLRTCFRASQITTRLIKKMNSFHEE